MFTWLKQLDRHFPVRYSVWLLCGVGMLLSVFAWVAFGVDGLHALIGQRRAGDAAAQLFQRLPVVARAAHCGVPAEPVDSLLVGAAGAHVLIHLDLALVRGLACGSP